MAKFYLITEKELEDLRSRLELSKWRQMDPKRYADGNVLVDDMHRTFNYHVCSWILEISK